MSAIFLYIYDFLKETHQIQQHLPLKLSCMRARAHQFQPQWDIFLATLLMLVLYLQWVGKA